MHDFIFTENLLSIFSPVFAHQRRQSVCTRTNNFITASLQQHLWSMYANKCDPVYGTHGDIYAYGTEFLVLLMRSTHPELVIVARWTFLDESAVVCGYISVVWILLQHVDFQLNFLLFILWKNNRCSHVTLKAHHYNYLYHGSILVVKVTKTFYKNQKNPKNLWNLKR